MTTHDFYRALGLDPSTPSPQIAADLDQRLAAPGLDSVQYDELMTARHILGDPAKRTTYDQALSDPATSLTTSDLYRLARSTTGHPQAAPAFGQQESWAVAPPAPAPAGTPQTFGAKASGLWAKVQTAFRTHPGPAIGGTAVAAVVVVGLIIAGAAAVVGDSTPGADTDTIASGDSGDNGELSLEDQIVAGVKEDVEKREKGLDQDRENFKNYTFLKPGETVRFTAGNTTTNPSGASVRDIYAEWDVTIDNVRLVNVYKTAHDDLPHEFTETAICYDERVDVLSGRRPAGEPGTITQPIIDGERIGAQPGPIRTRIPTGFKGDIYYDANGEATLKGEGPTTLDYPDWYKGGKSYESGFCMSFDERDRTSEPGVPGGVTGIVAWPRLSDSDEANVQAEKFKDESLRGWRLDLD